MSGLRLASYSRRALALESANWAEDVDPAVIASLLSEVAGVGQRVDLLKRHLFYGERGRCPDLRTRLYGNAVLDAAFSLSRNPLPAERRQLHAVLGVCTEAGELCESLWEALKSSAGVDATNFIEELGDVEWYVNLGADSVGSTLHNVLARNIAKLESRYATKQFREQDTHQRDLALERRKLEEDADEGAEDGPGSPGFLWQLELNPDVVQVADCHSHDVCFRRQEVLPFVPELGMSLWLPKTEQDEEQMFQMVWVRESCWNVKDRSFTVGVTAECEHFKFDSREDFLAAVRESGWEMEGPLALGSADTLTDGDQ